MSVIESFAYGFRYAWKINDKEKEAILQIIKDLKKRKEPNNNVADDIMSALDNGRGLSIVRIGDGEVLAMSQDLLPAKALKLRGHFLSHWHLPEMPDLESQNRVMDAVWKADWVGLPLGAWLECDTLLAQVMMKQSRLNARITHSVINYHLAKKNYLHRIMLNRNILTVGNTAQELSCFLNTHGYNCVGAVCPVNGVPDVDRVFELVRDYDFDIALVPAGVAAVPICVRVARELGKVAIDFGHMSDEWINGA